jgi:hypothetical protein
MKSMMPAKSYVKNEPKWNLQKTCDGQLFSKAIRQEKDVYDQDLKKYMLSRVRGIEKPNDFKLRRQSTVPA